MSTSRTTTQTTTAIGSIPITGGTSNPPSAPTHPSMPNPSDEEHELELQLERTREKKKAEEEAKKKAEEEAARRAAEEEQQWQEAAEKRRRIAATAAAQNCRGPSPGEATTSAHRGEVKKGKALQRAEASGGDPDNGNDGEDGDNDNDKEPCERCKAKKIPCLQQAGKRSSIICQVRANTYDRHIIKKLEWLMRDAARRREESLEAPIAGPSELPKKRRRVVDSEDEQEKERDQEEAGEEEEEGELALKKAWSEKGKEREE
ncbi:hypothetical protein EV368DRAFT_89575 [Lentinula lateritia]|nr:hypothetical protein EV368DRAFT_89575 [Lentinula lateritia]